MVVFLVFRYIRILVSGYESFVMPEMKTGR
jgi:hypothetical protein